MVLNGPFNHLFREEAACTVVRDTMFILGGIVDGDMTSSVELWNSEKEEWQASTDMPEVRKLRKRKF